VVGKTSIVGISV
jgi:hypothetical protein